MRKEEGGEKKEGREGGKVGRQTASLCVSSKEGPAQGWRPACVRSSSAGFLWTLGLAAWPRGLGCDVPHLAQDLECLKRSGNVSRDGC